LGIFLFPFGKKAYIIEMLMASEPLFLLFKEKTTAIYGKDTHKKNHRLLLSPGELWIFLFVARADAGGLSAEC
jgi:hypothetical protein